MRLVVRVRRRGTKEESCKTFSLAAAFLFITVALAVGVLQDTSNYEQAISSVVNSNYGVPSTSTYQNTSYGYVKWTLFLATSSLVEGNSTGQKSDIGPTSLTYDPSNRYLYVGDLGSDSVSVINTRTNLVVGIISGVNSPISMVYDPSNQYIYVASFRSGNITVIDTLTNKIVSEIPVDTPQAGMAFDSSSRYIYATDYDSNTVSVINSTSNSVVSTIDVGENPSSIAYDPVNNLLFVGHFVPIVLASIVSSPLATENVTTNGNLNSSLLITINGSTNKVVSNITVGSEVSAISFTPSYNLIYVASAGINSGYITIVNASEGRITSTISLYSSPYGMTYDPLNDYLYVTGYSSTASPLLQTSPIRYYANNVTVISSSSNEVVDSIAVGEEPRGIVYDPSSGYLYVTDFGPGAISIISTQFPTPSGSDAMIYEVTAVSVVIVMAGTATALEIRRRFRKNRSKL